MERSLCFHDVEHEFPGLRHADRSETHLIARDLDHAFRREGPKPARRAALRCDRIGRRVPTPELLARIPRDELLHIAEPFVERITLGVWSRLKQAELVARVHELVTGEAAGVRASMATAEARWVHPLLRCRPASLADVGVGADVREAAE